jgi:hypothetical protein
VRVHLFGQTWHGTALVVGLWYQAALFNEGYCQPQALSHMQVHAPPRVPLTAAGEQCELICVLKVAFRKLCHDLDAAATVMTEAAITQ